VSQNAPGILKVAPRTRTRGLTRRAVVLGHWLNFQLHSTGMWSWAVDAFVNVALTVWPMIVIGKKFAVLYFLAHGASRLFTKWREGAPANMKLVRYDYDARKLLHHRLVQKMMRAASMSPNEIAEFQQDALQLVVAYVRAHRADRKGTAIFANLLIEDGDEMVVVARNQEHREPLSRQSKMTSLAWNALKSGDIMVTGDVYDDYPETPPGKPYWSVLAIPVRLGYDTVAVVCVDSSRK